MPGIRNGDLRNLLSLNWTDYLLSRCFTLPSQHMFFYPSGFSMSTMYYWPVWSMRYNRNSFQLCSPHQDCREHSRGMAMSKRDVISPCMLSLVAEFVWTTGNCYNCLKVHLKPHFYFLIDTQCSATTTPESSMAEVPVLRHRLLKPWRHLIPQKHRQNSTSQ